MKKIIAVILLAASCLALSACSKTDVADALENGYWESSWYAELADLYCISIFEFEDGKVTHAFDGANSYIKKGEYNIGRGEIQIAWDDGEEEVLKYDYKDGQLVLTDDTATNTYENHG